MAEVVDIYQRFLSGMYYEGIMRGERFQIKTLTDAEKKDNAKVDPSFGRCNVMFRHTTGDALIIKNNNPASFLSTRQELQSLSLYFKRQRFSFSTTHNGVVYNLGRKFDPPIKILVADMGNKAVKYTYNGIPLDSFKNHYVCVPVEGDTPLWEQAMQLSKLEFHKCCRLVTTPQEMLDKLRLRKSKKKNKDGARYRVVARVVNKSNNFETIGYILSYYDRQRKKWRESAFSMSAFIEELVKNNIRNAKIIAGNSAKTIKGTAGFELTYGSVASLPTFYTDKQKLVNQSER